MLVIWAKIIKFNKDKYWGGVQAYKVTLMFYWRSVD